MFAVCFMAWQGGLGPVAGCFWPTDRMFKPSDVKSVDGNDLDIQSTGNLFSVQPPATLTHPACGHRAVERSQLIMAERSMFQDSPSQCKQTHFHTF